MLISDNSLIGLCQLRLFREQHLCLITNGMISLLQTFSVWLMLHFYKHYFLFGWKIIRLRACTNMTAPNVGCACARDCCISCRWQMFVIIFCVLMFYNHVLHFGTATNAELLFIVHNDLKMPLQIYWKSMINSEL